MDFKKLEIEKEKSWIKRISESQHTKKTILYMLLGAIAGFLWFYFTEGKFQDSITLGDIFKSTAIGGFFGFFITNSPCARGRC